MKKGLLFIMCLLALTAQAKGGMMKRHKTFFHLEYRVDTFHYHGQIVLKQRYEGNEIYESYGKDTNENSVAAMVYKLQGQLDEMNKNIIENNDAATEPADKYLEQIKRRDTRFDHSMYEHEYDAYLKILDQQDKNRKAEERRAEEIARAEQKKAEEIARQERAKKEQEKAKAMANETKMRNESVSAAPETGDADHGYAYGKIVGASKAAGSMDKKNFTGAFGSIGEYNLEQTLMYNSSHHHLVMVIGAKGWWLREIPSFMAEQLGCSNHIDGDSDYYPTNFDVHPGITMGDEDASSVHIRSDIDDNLRVKKVTITGNTQLLTKLFLFYWTNSDLKYDANKMRRGCLLYQNSGSDRVCYNWKGAKPSITITKNPTFPVPLPLAVKKDE